MQTEGLLQSQQLAGELRQQKELQQTNGALAQAQQLAEQNVEVERESGNRTGPSRARRQGGRASR